MKTRLTIGLFGFGCVGQGFCEVLKTLPAGQINIKSICVKQRGKERPSASARFVFDPAEILNDPEIDLVVEVIDNAEDAFAIVAGALKHGKSVVSANKKMIAHHLDELLELQRLGTATLLYEAAVAGSIPVIRVLEAYFSRGAVQSCGGIVNGSSNFVLSRMQDAGVSFDEALQEAQHAGFAESDPTLDLGGFDARNKLGILVHHAFGRRLRADKIPKFGLRAISRQDVSFALSHGLRIVPAALAQRAAPSADEAAGKLEAWVAPLFVTESERLATVRAENNVTIITDVNGVETELVGKGAGGLPTGAAVLADVLAFRRGFRYAWQANDSPQPAASSGSVNIYLRYNPDCDAEKLPWESCRQLDLSNDNDCPCGVVLGRIKLHALLEYSFRNHRQCFVGFLSAQAMEQIRLQQELLAV